MDEPRVVVVTGGTGGLGRVVVETLVEDGWTVHVPWRTRAHADALGAAVANRSQRVHLIEADLSERAAVERLFAHVDLTSGRLDALCNLAGGYTGGPIAEISPSGWDRMMAINATTTFLCCRAAVPRLRAAGAGAVVNVASAAALAPRPAMSAYVAAKAAVVALTRALSLELAPDRITVNALAPTTIDTADTRRDMPNADRSRWVEPAELAAAIRWLIGPDGRKVTGSILEFVR
jgi:NAD(P)-dependent dehydrogenase (short-subunit alcohol dehydrogenase family)